MKILRAVGITMHLVSAVFAQSAIDARQVARSTFPSVVMLVMEDERGQPLSLGSGFFVSEGVVASNFHVVRGASRGYAKLIGKQKRFNISGIVGLDQKHDLVLLGVDDASSPSLKMGDSAAAAIGDNVYAVGNPKGLEGTFSAGIVSGIRRVDANALLQITAPISPGSSGGPVLDINGLVIGVAVATYKGGQNLNFAIPSSYLEQLLRAERTLKPLSSKLGKVTSSILDEIGGNKITDGVEVTGFRWPKGQIFTRNGKLEFSLSFVNRLREAVSNISCLVIFYDKNDTPIDFVLLRCNEVIPAGLGKRLDNGAVSYTTATEMNFHAEKMDGKIEFRILGFSIVE